ncbi:hypothetical protein QL285_015032 [Trifolium repens]|nr:hypothetical protein QL285_015032 [Trifolium repens]
MRQAKNSFIIYFSSATEGIHLLCLITGYSGPERTFQERRAAQKPAKISNLNKEGESTTKAMRDEPQGMDYCGMVSIKQEPEWTPPNNNNGSEGIFWDDLADIEVESQGDNFSEVSKPSREDSWKPVIPLDTRWKKHSKWMKRWMKIAPTSRHDVKRPFSGKRIRKIEYQQHVVREWQLITYRIFDEDYMNAMCSNEEVSVGNQNEKFMALKEKKRERGTEGEFQERVAKRSQLPPKKEDPGSATIICQIGKAGVNALCDVDSSVNVIPLSLADKFKLASPIAGTSREHILANQSSIHSVGTVRNVLVKVKDLEFLVDFMILDIGEDEEDPVILGRPFLATCKTLIDMNLGEITLRSGGKSTTVNLFNAGKEKCFMLEWKDREATPPTPDQEVQVKVEITELENEMAQLEIDTAQEEEVPEELTEKLNRLTIEVDIRATWVKAWGRNQKVAIRSKFGVNTPPLKKPAAERKQKEKRKAGLMHQKNKRRNIHQKAKGSPS